jgi:hypothetical protein
MRSPLIELFGSTDETKVWSVVVPYAMSNTVSLDEIVRATKIRPDKVEKVLQIFESHNMIGKDRKMIKFTCQTARAIHQLLHAGYDDALMRDQERMLKGTENTETTDPE